MAEEKEELKKPKSKTISNYRKFKAGRVALYASTFTCPLLPASVVTAVNWNDWFVETESALPLGFASMLITVIVAILGIMNSEKVLKKAEYALFYLALVFACIGITNLFLASLFSEIGRMWLYTAGGLLGSGASMLAEKKLIEPNIELYGKLIEDNLLSTKAKKKQEKIERAKAEALQEAEYLKEQRRRATTE